MTNSESSAEPNSPQNDAPAHKAPATTDHVEGATADQAAPEAGDPAQPSSPHTGEGGHSGGHGPVKAAGFALMVGAIGVVFGDIGTSPLYALQTLFALNDRAIQPNETDVFGAISLVFWSIMIIVSLKYVHFVMKADNEGEGGVMALAHLTRRVVRPGGKRFGLVMVLGVLGASLFYGDSVITPAISVLSAIEGLKVTNPSLTEYILPIGIVIITGLFMGQRFGTHVVGRVFGPVMVVWFLVIGAIGVPHIVHDPTIIRALLPTYAVAFVIEHAYLAFIAMGAVVLAITGAEALYADMGHFGRDPIKRAWFFLVMPCLVLNYLGQGAQILRDPASADNPFFKSAPSWAQFPLVILATVATVIASQAVISGAFSVSRQAERLGYLPRLTVKHTSTHSGQIYVPAINWILYGGVIVLLVMFQASERLATAYGLAVTGTLLITTCLFVIYAQAAWKWPTWRLILVGGSFFAFELMFFAANLTKVAHGGWIPLVIAGSVATVMFTWWRGRELVSERRARVEGTLADLLDEIHDRKLLTVPGNSIFLHPNKHTAPLAMRENAAFNHVVHENVLIVSTTALNIPHVEPEDRAVVDDLGDPHDHITHVELKFGFQDDQDVPGALAYAHDHGLLEFHPEDATYFLSRITVQRFPTPTMSTWRKRLFIGMAHNAASPTEYFRLPIERTVVMGAQIKL